MILQKLCEYYDRIDGDPTQSIAQEGFAPQNISFAIVLNEDGCLHEIQDIRNATSNKPVPVVMRLPYEKRTSGVKAMFLWDKAEYLLGYVSPELMNAPEVETSEDEKKREKKISRVAECHLAAKILHLRFQDQVHDKSYQLLCRFFENWRPEQLSENNRRTLEEVATGFGVFRFVSQARYLHDINQIRQVWSDSLHQPCVERVSGICLITGAEAPLARLHPVVKGVRDAQSSGASIVSFNDDAFTSYGKKQSYNAPVSEYAAFKYTTALNRLLERDSDRKLQIGDTTCVFWSDKPAAILEDIFAFGLDPETQFEDEARTSEIKNILRRVRDGHATYPDAGVGFQILGLSPNASRLSIRFWVRDKAENIVNLIALHQWRLQITKGPKDREFIPLWLVLAQTARESKEIQPLLGGSLLRSILTGSRYPESLMAALIRRVRAERDVGHVKAATIKAILIRNYAKDVSIMLDTERTESSYHLGRLFSCLERAQEDALPGLNATIKDRYFGAASATPSSVFPRLIRLSQHHVGKLEGGKKVVAEKRIQEIMGRLTSFPGHMKLEDQGLFAIGYYHQRQDLFRKKVDSKE